MSGIWTREEIQKLVDYLDGNGWCCQRNNAPDFPGHSFTSVSSKVRWLRDKRKSGGVLDEAPPSADEVDRMLSRSEAMPPRQRMRSLREAGAEEAPVFPKFPDAKKEPREPLIVEVPSPPALVIEQVREEKGEPFPVHPVEQREHKDRESALRQQISQLVEELRVAKERQKFLDRISDAGQPPKLVRREKRSGVREMAAVVLASDWHVEEVVEPESVAYRNRYNLEVSEQRIERFFNAIIWQIEHHRASGRLAIRDLALWLGGDLITGYIHPELMETNELSPSEAVLWLLSRLQGGIITLLDVLDLEHVELPCSYGNHGRTTEKRRVSSGYANSWEWLMYHILKDRMADEKRVHFEITNSAHQYVEVFDQVLHFHHGDDVKYQGGVGGLGIPLLKAVPLWDRIKPAAVHNIGHHHTLRDFGRAVTNGSLIGFSTYSQSIRAEFEPPQQAMYFVDSSRGKCMPTALWVGDREPESVSK